MSQGQIEQLLRRCPWAADGCFEYAVGVDGEGQNDGSRASRSQAAVTAVDIIALSSPRFTCSPSRVDLL